MGSQSPSCVRALSLGTLFPSASRPAPCISWTIVHGTQNPALDPRFPGSRTKRPGNPAWYDLHALGCLVLSPSSTMPVLGSQSSRLMCACSGSDVAAPSDPNTSLSVRALRPSAVLSPALFYWLPAICSFHISFT